MAKKKRGGNSRVPIYKSYVFRDKEPVIDETRTMIEDHFGRKLDGKMLRQIHEAGGPTASCLNGWFHGTTLRPQNVTVEATGRALGWRRVWQKIK